MHPKLVIAAKPIVSDIVKSCYVTGGGLCAECMTKLCPKFVSTVMGIPIKCLSGEGGGLG